MHITEADVHAKIRNCIWPIFFDIFENFNFFEFSTPKISKKTRFLLPKFLTEPSFASPERVKGCEKRLKEYQTVARSKFWHFLEFLRNYGKILIFWNLKNAILRNRAGAIGSLNMLHGVKPSPEIESIHFCLFPIDII